MDLSIRYVRVTSAGNSAVLALYKGIEVDEINKILSATFPDPDERRVVALIDLHNNKVIPLHTVSLYPELLDSASYNVLFGGKGQRIATIQQRQLFIAIGLLEEESGLHFNQAQMLRALVLRDDEMVMAAQEVFEMDGNLEELKDTLLRIARVVSGDTHEPVTTITATGASSSLDNDPSATNLNMSLILDEYQNFLDKVVTDLHMRKMIDEDALGKLRDLIDSSDPQIRNILEEFQKSKDLNALVDSLLVLSKVGSSDAQDNESSSERRARKYEEHAKEMEQVIAGLVSPTFPTNEVSNIIQDITAAIATASSSNTPTKLKDIDILTLQLLLEKEHPYLQLIYEDYEKKEDYESLIENLEALAITYGITNVLVAMENKGLATRVDSILLKQLFTAGNPSVLAAWDVYVEEHDEDDFCDSLYRILVRRGSSDNGISSNNNSNTSSTAPAPSRSKQQLRRLVVQLHGSGKLTDDQGAALMKLVDLDDAQVYHAYDVFLNTGDLIILVENLLKHAENAVKQEKNSPSKQKESHLSSSQGDLNEASLWKTIRRTINRLFIHKFISSPERFVLIGLVNSKDEAVRQAMEQFARYRIQEALVSQLQAIVARDVKDRPLQERTKAQTDLYELIEALLNDSKIDSDIFLCLSELIEAQHPLVVKEYEKFTTTNNIKELVDKLLEIGVANVADSVGAGGGEALSNSFSREVRMEGLINSLSISKKIQQIEGRLLVKSLREGDPRVLAAFDVYDDIPDESDLVDTLRRVAERLFEEEKDRLDFGTHVPPHHPPHDPQRRPSLGAGIPIESEEELPAGLKRQRSTNYDKQVETQRKPKKHESESLHDETSQGEVSMLKESLKESGKARRGSDDDNVSGSAKKSSDPSSSSSPSKRKNDEDDQVGVSEDVAPTITKEQISPPATRLKGKQMRLEQERKKNVQSAIAGHAFRRRSSSRLDDDDNDNDNNNENQAGALASSAAASSSSDGATGEEEEKGTEVLKPVEPGMIIEMVADEMLREGSDAKTVNTIKRLSKEGNKDIDDALARFQASDDLEGLKSSLKSLAKKNKA